MQSLKEYIKSKLSYKSIVRIRSLVNFFSASDSFLRKKNYIKYSFELFNNSKITFVPPVFSVAITDNCNLRCPSCLFLLENDKRFFSSNITIEKFNQILDKYNNQKKAQTIFLTGGEPLLHPNIEELINICLDYNLKPKISTNGILLKNNVQLLKKIEYINVSVDSYDEDSFKKYRGGSSTQFNMIKEGVKALKENNINFSLSFLLNKDNVSEYEKMLLYAYEIKPKLVYFHNVNPHGSSNFVPLLVDDENTRTFLKKITSCNDYPFDIYLPPIFDVNSKKFRYAKCNQPWYFFCFNSIGDVSFCCHLSPNSNIGNVFNNYDFNSIQMVKFRDSIISGKLPESCLFCQRRFTDGEFGFFNSDKNRWIIN